MTDPDPPQARLDGPPLPDCLHRRASVTECDPIWRVPAAQGADGGFGSAARPGVLLLHGYTGCPWELAPLADALSGRGYAVAAPLLAGHGRGPEALEPTRWPDWDADADAACRALLARLGGERAELHVVGLSMGALLAARVAARHPGVRSVTLLAPAVRLPRGVRTALQLVGRAGWPQRVPAPPRRGRPRPTAPSHHSVAPTLSLLALQREVRRQRPLSPTPALTLHGTADRTIPAARARPDAERLMGAGGVWRAIRGAGHVLPRTAQGPEVVEAVCDFIASQARVG